MRIFPVALAGLAVVSALTDASAQTPAHVVAPMPAGRLSDALLALAADANVNIAFDAALIGDRRTRGLSQPAPLPQALEELLRGSGLTYAISRSGDVSVSAAATTEAQLAPQASETEADAPIIVMGYRRSLDRAEARARRYDGLVEIISADAIGKLPDANIADALDRLPSVYRISDQGEGRYLSLRGISQELDTVTVNGVTIAASDTDGRAGRAAPLDVLSASSVADVEIHSVITPDRDANAIGGLINVRTPAAHDFAGRVAHLTTEIGVLDADTSREIHAVRGAYANVFGPGGAFGLYVGGEHWVREYLSPFYDTAEVAPSQSGVPGLYPDRLLLGASAGRRERTSLTASLEWRGQSNNGLWLRTFAADYNDEELRPEFLLYRRGDLSAPSADAFSWRGVRARAETRHERQERPVRQIVLGGRWSLDGSWSIEANLTRTSAEEQNPYLNYYETLGDVDPASASAPDIANFILRDGVAIPNGAFVTPSGVSVFDGSLQRLFRIRRISSAVREDIDTQQFDLRRHGVFAARPFSLQFGLKHLARVKSVDDTDLRFNFLGMDSLGAPGLAGTLNDYGWGGADAIVPNLQMPFADPTGFEALFAARPDLFVFDAMSSHWNSVEDDYRIREEIWAGYAMGALDVTPALRVTLGGRVEHTNVRASANTFVEALTFGPGFAPGVDPFVGTSLTRTGIVPTFGENEFTNFSPAILAKWDNGGAWVFRASLTHTFARPDYVDLAPIGTLSASAVADPSSGAPIFSAINEIGNPRLRPTESRNWDASLRYNLPGNTGWLALAGFYKSLDGVLFETTQAHEDVVFAGVRFDTYTEVTTTNSGDGHVGGVEISARYDLLAAPAPFDGFGVLVNAAFIDSSVSAPSLLQARPLEDQANALYSAQLYYERDRFQARLAYSYQGAAARSDRWSEPTANNQRAPWSRLDAKVAFDLNDNWRATLAGANLTDTAYRTNRSTYPTLVGSGPGYEVYGREYRLSLTRRW